LVIPSDELKGVSTPDGHLEFAQPYVIVGRPGTKPTDAGWFDIANLLRCDIPYWPTPLRDHNAIMAWRPGAPIRKLGPEHVCHRPTVCL
jgi:hypothetical protein